MPGNKVGLTLRAYRKASDVTPTDISEREDDDSVFTERAAAARAELDDDELPEFEWNEEQLDAIAAAPAEDEIAEQAVEQDRDGGRRSHPGAEDEPTTDAAEDEEVPVFLSHQGKLLLFPTGDALVSFVRSGKPHDMTQLSGWKQLAKSVRPGDVVAAEDDSYELDLVVKNLRGGPDAWDAELVLRAGEIARDLGYALQLHPVLVALSSGSPLDDLDEALRATSGGGFSGLFSRRKLRKIGAEQASLGWRTIIGKISAALDWRD